MPARHFLSLFDLSPAELRSVLSRAIDLKRMQQEAVSHQPLANKTLVMLFEQSSTRTRLGFEIGMHQLGGKAVFLSARDIQLGRGEAIEHTAKVLSGMADVVMIRTSSHERIETFAEHSEVPVINGMTSYNHPCQLLADMQTYLELRGDIKNAKVAFLGDGYNMCNSYINAACQFGFELRVSCPKGYEPSVPAEAKAQVSLLPTPQEAVAGATLVVTDVWTSMAHEQNGAKARNERLAIFRPYQANPALMDAADKDALFMHCLPAHPSEEVSEDMLDDPRSVVWQEANNRLHSQKALLEFLLT